MKNHIGVEEMSMTRQGSQFQLQRIKYPKCYLATPGHQKEHRWINS